MKRTRLLCKAGTRYTLVPGPHPERRARRWLPTARAFWARELAARVAAVVAYPRERLELTFNAAGWAWLRTLPPGRYELSLGNPEEGRVFGYFRLHWTGQTYWVEVPRLPWDRRLVPVPPGPEL